MDPLETLEFAIEKYPHRTEVIPVRELIMDSARQNERRPAFVQLELPDEMVKGLRGREDQEPNLLLLVRIPREVLSRSESLIVLPNEVR
ncbi:MAG TPA: hypothetical protein VGS22_00715 [Thermoanaerobaculia bacterium]|nr:hypothetical protein [Thermoanaerobaculia bacterium]